ncbi:hypothetical protein C0J52_18035 [Blattella germanica]|nr:hypothetical protein C0J52_18035 [Blattella germanica]
MRYRSQKQFFHRKTRNTPFCARANWSTVSYHIPTIMLFPFASHHCLDVGLGYI